jgi:lysophospholipase L1-like esterase
MVGRRRAILFTGILAAALATATPAVAAESAAHATPADAGTSVPHYQYYLALGDSLSVGWQPKVPSGAGRITSQGYTNDILAWLKRSDPGVKYLNDGCPGETTTTMLNGHCPYPEKYKTQISDATTFLKNHRHDRILVTIDIGANDVDGCLTNGSISRSCITKGLAATTSNVPKILTDLRAAAGSEVTFYAMNYYDPFLAEWLTGTAGQSLAEESLALAAKFNGILDAAYAHYKVPVANVSGQFDTTDLKPIVTLPNGLKVPLDVARICEWTWMCAAAPVGPNIHANAEGYAQIADAFEATFAAKN